MNEMPTRYWSPYGMIETDSENCRYHTGDDDIHVTLADAKQAIDDAKAEERSQIAEIIEARIKQVFSAGRVWERQALRDLQTKLEER